MRRRRLLPIAVLVAALVSAAPTAAQSSDELEIAPVTRLPFPERGYVVSLRSGASLDGSMIRVRENGAPVSDAFVTPLAASGIRFGVVLAIDASNSMEGAPFDAAIAAAKRFVTERQPEAEVGFIAFNGDVVVLQTPTNDAKALEQALGSPPGLAYGTRIYDALDRSIDLLADSKIGAGSVVLLSDGADVGSVHRLERIVAAARRQRVRIFTVGLRSGSFDGSALRSIAARTGGTYAEATSAEELAAIYSELGRRLAGEYVVQYRSKALPESHVDVEIALAGVAEASAEYVAPTPAGVAPYHRPLITRFVLSRGSVAFIALFAAALLCLAVALLARGPTRDLVERVSHFSVDAPRALRERDIAAAIAPRVSTRYTKGWWARLERDVAIARIEMNPRRIVAFTGIASLGMFVVFAMISPIFAVLGLIAPPIAMRSIVRWKLARLRDSFADQLPTALQVLASALRAGHSFSGALGVVVENTHEPAKSELARVVQDDQLGVLPEVALRKMAERMANRDVEQVALLAELQRTSGGNSAEVLDTVVDTIRGRGELRRLVKTLTAQGRMARWILTALPIAMTIFLWLMNPDVMNPFFESGAGQVAVVVAVMMVAAGSALIQRIIDIDV